MPTRCGSGCGRRQRQQRLSQLLFGHLGLAQDGRGMAWAAGGCEAGLLCYLSISTRQVSLTSSGRCCCLFSGADLARPVWWLAQEKTSWGRWRRQKACWYVRPKSPHLVLSAHFVKLRFERQTCLAPKLRQSSSWCSRSKTKYSHTYW